LSKRIVRVFIGENQCLVMLDETTNLRPLGDDFIDRARCLRLGGCYTSVRRPFCYQSIGTAKTLLSAQCYA